MVIPAYAGLLGLLIGFCAAAASVVCLTIGHILLIKKKASLADTLSWAGRVAAVLCAIALTVCVVALGYCFIAGDFRLEYVLNNHSSNTGSLAWLYRLSGIWAGREGSLLFWAWLISVFGAVVAIRRMNATRPLDNIACIVIQAVLLAFIGVMLFSEANMPFTVADSKYFNSDGTITTAATLLGMNTLLEHWAMAIHPPTLFIGYAGLTVPFAYAIAALVTKDSSREWVDSSTRYALFSWLFLTIGIGLGALWAYTVLGWGGYWGWDAVENASLLSWLMTVALIHSFTVYRTRGAFKGWSVMCACLTFCFVIVGTFISRSGLVQSVHAFEGDPVSLVLFGALIVLSVLLGAVLLIVRRKTFAAVAEDNFQSFASKGAMYYITDVVIVVMTVLLTYMTVASALPSFLPFGGQSLSTGSYNVVARPVGILFMGAMAVCPLMSWGKTDMRTFLKHARIPAICALVPFIALMVYFVTYLSPGYDAIIAAGGSTAEELLEQGPAWYYKALTVVGFAVACLLLFNALFMAGRALGIGRKRQASADAEGAKAATSHKHHIATSMLGGAVTHMGMAIILVGLIGSSMYITENASYLSWDEDSDSCAEAFAVGDYRLYYTGQDISQADNGDYLYTTEYDVYHVDNGVENYIGHVAPQVELVTRTQQQRLNAAVISLPTEDLFVVYRGTSSAGDALSLDVRVNPLVSYVWVGFYLMIFGMLISTLGRRRMTKAAPAAAEPEPAAEPAAPAAAEPAAAAEKAQAE